MYHQLCSTCCPVRPVEEELVLSLWCICAWAERMQAFGGVSNRFLPESLLHPYPLLLVTVNLISSEASGSWIISGLLLLLVNCYN